MEEQQPNIELEETSHGGRYFIPANTPEEDAAELTFAKLDDTTISADRTFVPQRYRGQGIARLLVERLVADARINNIKIVPACSYVSTAFARHPEWADVKK